MTPPYREGDLAAAQGHGAGCGLARQSGIRAADNLKIVAKPRREGQVSSSFDNRLV
jgi:hypothetical protein